MARKKDKPRKLKEVTIRASRPNVVDSPDDPRYRAYQDSLDLYKNNEWFPNYMKKLWDVPDIEIENTYPLSERMKKVHLKSTPGENRRIYYSRYTGEYGSSSIERDPYPTYHTDIAPESFIKTNVHGDLLPVYKKPTNPIYLRGSKEAQQAERDWNKSTTPSSMQPRGINSLPSNIKQRNYKFKAPAISSIPHPTRPQLKVIHIDGKPRYFENMAGTRIDYSTHPKFTKQFQLEGAGSEEFDNTLFKPFGGDINMKTKNRKLVNRNRGINTLPTMEFGGHLLNASQAGMQGASIGAMFGGVGAPIGAGVGAAYGLYTSIRDQNEENRLREKQEADRLKTLATMKHNRDSSILDGHSFNTSPSMFGYMPTGGKLPAGALGDMGYGINSVPVDAKASMLVNEEGNTQGYHETGDNVPIQNSYGEVAAIGEPGEIVMKTAEGKDFVIPKRPLGDKGINYANKYKRLSSKVEDLEKKIVDRKTSPVQRNTWNRELKYHRIKVNEIPDQVEKAKFEEGVHEEQQMAQMAQMGEVPIASSGMYLDNPINKELGFHLNPSNSNSPINTFDFYPRVEPFRSMRNISTIPTYSSPPVNTNFKSSHLNIAGVNNGNNPITQFNNSNSNTHLFGLNKSTPGYTGDAFSDDALDKLGGKKTSKGNMGLTRGLAVGSSIIANLQNRRDLDKVYERSLEDKFIPTTFTRTPENVYDADQLRDINSAYAEGRDALVGSSAQSRNANVGNMLANKYRALNRTHGDRNRMREDIRRSNIAGINETDRINTIGRMQHDRMKFEDYMGYKQGIMASRADLNTSINNLAKEGNQMNLDRDSMLILADAYEAGTLNLSPDIIAMLEKRLGRKLNTEQ